MLTIIAGVNGEQGVARVASTKAGDTITFEWRDWPDGSQPGSIDPSHKGPCAVYMKKVDNAAASNNAQGSGWFKIMEDGYDNSTQKWCTEKLIPNNGHMAATIPKDLAPGYYLMRPELLALHQADKTPPDPQFYIGCAQIFLTSGGSSNPKDTVSIPGYVDLNTPAMAYNIWRVPLQLPFPDFGPPLYSRGNSKRDIGTRSTMKQTIGLKPAGCVMENANWCGFLPPKYTDQTSCYSVRGPYQCMRSDANGISLRRIALRRHRSVMEAQAQQVARTVTIGTTIVLRFATNVALGPLQVPHLSKAKCPPLQHRWILQRWSMPQVRCQLRPTK